MAIPERGGNCDSHERTVTADVAVPAGGRTVHGSLSVPRLPRALVIFAHGSGSGRFSPRNQFVARELEKAGLATLLIDLLEEDEAADRKSVFDIRLLADRLCAVTDWANDDSKTNTLRLGFFGASTGAGAALVAAARRPKTIGAVVARGGRPDLAGESLKHLAAPTLLLVGSRDPEVLDLNRRALAQLRGVNELAIIDGATHLFPEPGTLEQVALAAQQWFLRYLGR
jgi:putative phosphoribosyl transferase